MWEKGRPRDVLFDHTHLWPGFNPSNIVNPKSILRYQKEGSEIEHSTAVAVELNLENSSSFVRANGHAT
jgi:hypothetical protein